MKGKVIKLMMIIIIGIEYVLYSIVAFLWAKNSYDVLSKGESIFISSIKPLPTILLLIAAIIPAFFGFENKIFTIFYFCGFFYLGFLGIIFAFIVKFKILKDKKRNEK